MGYEALAVHTALTAWEPLLRERRVVFWVDNSSAEGAFVKGSNRAADINLLSGWFWQRCALAQIRPQVLRVSSASNIADGPSRGQWSLLSAFACDGDVLLPQEVHDWYPRDFLEAVVWGSS